MIATQSPEMSICYFPHSLRGLQYQTTYFLNRLLNSHLSHMCACGAGPPTTATVAVRKAESRSNCSLFPKQKQHMQGAHEKSQKVTSKSSLSGSPRTEGLRPHSPFLASTQNEEIMRGSSECYHWVSAIPWH